MKSKNDKIRNLISSKDKRFTQHIQKLAETLNIDYSDDFKDLLYNTIEDCFWLRQLKQQQFEIMWKEAKRYSIKHKIGSVFAKIQHLFSKLKWWSDCLCLDCIRKSLEHRNCGMKKYMEENLEEDFK